MAGARRARSRALELAGERVDALRRRPLEHIRRDGHCLHEPLDNFFEQDFLPTVLGLGGVRDRGYAVPVAMERKLKETYSALVADAHALADGGRPSLQIDILPVGHRTNHAKIVLIHRKRLLRLIIASANLTHAAFLLTAADTLMNIPTAELVATHYPDTPWPKIAQTAYLADNPYRSLVDCSPAAEVLGWRPQYSWREPVPFPAGTSSEGYYWK